VKLIISFKNIIKLNVEDDEMGEAIGGEEERI
jgi:hypothetical protein